MKTLLKIFGVLFLLGAVVTIFDDGSTTSDTKKVNTIENKKENFFLLSFWGKFLLI